MFYSFLGLLAISLFCFFILNNIFNNSRQELKELEDALNNQSWEVSPGLESSILAKKEKIDNFKTLISNRKTVSEIFSILQEISHPKVWFSSFELKSEENSIGLVGQAKDFESLGQQIFILKSENLIESFDLQSISISKEGRINFNLSLSLDPQVYNVTQESSEGNYE